MSAGEAPASGVALSELARGNEAEADGGLALTTGATGDAGVALGSQATTRTETTSKRAIETGEMRIAPSVAHSPSLYRLNARWDTIGGWPPSRAARALPSLRSVSRRHSWDARFTTAPLPEERAPALRRKGRQWVRRSRPDVPLWLAA